MFKMLHISYMEYYSFTTDQLESDLKSRDQKGLMKNIPVTLFSQ